MNKVDTVMRNDTVKNMNAPRYDPRPAADGAVVLPRDLTDLTERLAERVHDLWAAQRIAEGWTLGSRRDDAAKTHPGLVPYAQLAESEKEYDRQTAIGTLKAIISFGYRVEKAGETPASA